MELELEVSCRNDFRSRYSSLKLRGTLNFRYIKCLCSGGSPGSLTVGLLIRKTSHSRKLRQAVKDITPSGNDLEVSPVTVRQVANPQTSSPCVFKSVPSVLNKKRIVPGLC